MSRLLGAGHNNQFQFLKISLEKIFLIETDYFKRVELSERWKHARANSSIFPEQKRISRLATKATGNTCQCDQL